jgi:hypothetical protein
LEAAALVDAVLEAWPPFRLQSPPQYVGLVSRTYRPLVIIPIEGAR